MSNLNFTYSNNLFIQNRQLNGIPNYKKSFTNINDFKPRTKSSYLLKDFTPYTNHNHYENPVNYDCKLCSIDRNLKEKNDFPLSSLGYGSPDINNEYETPRFKETYSFKDNNPIQFYNNNNYRPLSYNKNYTSNYNIPNPLASEVFLRINSPKNIFPNRLDRKLNNLIDNFENITKIKRRCSSSDCLNKSQKNINKKYKEYNLRNPNSFLNQRDFNKDTINNMKRTMLSNVEQKLENQKTLDNIYRLNKLKQTIKNLKSFDYNTIKIRDNVSPSPKKENGNIFLNYLSRNRQDYKKMVGTQIIKEDTKKYINDLKSNYKKNFSVGKERKREIFTKEKRRQNEEFDYPERMESLPNYCEYENKKKFQLSPKKNRLEELMSKIPKHTKSSYSKGNRYKPFDLTHPHQNNHTKRIHFIMPSNKAKFYK